MLHIATSIHSDIVISLPEMKTKVIEIETICGFKHFQSTLTLIKDFLMDLDESFVRIYHLLTH